MSADENGREWWMARVEALSRERRVLIAILREVLAGEPEALSAARRLVRGETGAEIIRSATLACARRWL